MSEGTGELVVYIKQPNDVDEKKKEEKAIETANRKELKKAVQIVAKVLKTYEIVRNIRQTTYQSKLHTCVAGK